jgi:hypothetical protein
VEGDGAKLLLVRPFFSLPQYRGGSATPRGSTSARSSHRRSRRLADPVMITEWSSAASSLW